MNSSKSFSSSNAAPHAFKLHHRKKNDPLVTIARCRAPSCVSEVSRALLQIHTLTCSWRTLVPLRAGGALNQRRGASTYSRTNVRKLRTICAGKRGLRNSSVVHKCTICNKSFSTALQQGLHLWSKRHLILLAQSKYKRLPENAEESVSWQKQMAKELKANYPDLWAEVKHHKEVQERRQALLNSWTKNYAEDPEWFKAPQDCGFYQWSPGERVPSAREQRRRAPVDAVEWIRKREGSPQALDQVRRRLTVHRPPRFCVPALPLTLRGKNDSRPCKLPEGYPFSPPAFCSLIAAQKKGLDLSGVQFVATSMALRTLAAGSSAESRAAVYVQRYRHMLLLSWKLHIKQNLMDPGFQLERVLTGGSPDNPYSDLGSTHRLQMGTINGHNVLVSGEVDAVDDAGLVVEIKSSSNTSPDLSIQNMLCGVGKRACVEVKEQPVMGGDIIIASLRVTDLAASTSEQTVSILYQKESREEQVQNVPDNLQLVSGIARRGVRVQFLLDWLRQRDELFAHSGPTQSEHGGGEDQRGILSETYEVRFNEVGTPYLMDSKHQLMPCANDCEYLFGSDAPPPSSWGARRGGGNIKASANSTLGGKQARLRKQIPEDHSGTKDAAIQSMAAPAVQLNHDDPKRTVFVANLGSEASEATVKSICGSEFGVVEHVKIISDHKKRVSKGFGFVTFKHAASATAAVQQGELDLGGNKVVVVAHKGNRKRDKSGCSSSCGSNTM